MNREFWIGTAPFCGTNNKNQCGVTPGFSCARTEKGTGIKKCWRGHKALCRYDFKTFKNTPIYRKLKLQNNNIDLNEFFPEFKWFGTAPICGKSRADLTRQGYVFVKSDKCGDGHCCTIGAKLLGMKPYTEAQKEELKNEQEKLDQEQLKKQEFLDKAITTLQTIGDHGIKLGSKLPVVGPFVKVVGDGISTLTNLLKDKENGNNSSKVSGYNDSFINPITFNSESKINDKNTSFNEVAKGLKDYEYIKRYSIIKDVYDNLLKKDYLDSNEEDIIKNLRIFLDDIKKDKNYKDLINFNVNKSTKELLSDVQKNLNTKRYLTNYAKDYYKYKNISNSLPVHE